MTNEQIKKLSTHRLLNIFRMVRSSIYGREPERIWDQYHYDEDDLFDRLKAELDTREHIPRKKGKK